MDKDRSIDIMGIVNLTDDSYFAQSRCADVDSVLLKVEKMKGEGASVIDFGACSTRPGSEAVGAEEEWRRLKPALKAVREAFPDILISVDTYWSEVVSRTCDLIGGFIVNDISAGEDDPMMLPLVGSLGLTYVAMHKRGNPLNMHQMCDYDDVVSDVAAYFRAFAEKADRNGLKEWILDPGFGFAKTVEQNYELLDGLDRLCPMSDPAPRILVGVSRKSMIYRPLGITPEEALAATQVVHYKALEKGAGILRVHDVAECRQTISLYRMMSGGL